MQTIVAFVNLASYYAIGIPFGVLLGWIFHLGVKVRIYLKLDNIISFFNLSPIEVRTN